MSTKRDGFRNDKGKLAISKDDLAAKIAEIAEEELKAWHPASGVITVDKPAGIAHVRRYLEYLWGAIPKLGGREFDPEKNPWSAVFVSYCVTKAFADLGGRGDGDAAFGKRVPLVPSRDVWKCYFDARLARWQFSRRNRAHYWAYRAGLPLEKGDIVIKDRRTRKPGESGQSLEEPRIKPTAPLHADIVVGVDADQARLIGGGHAGCVKEVRYPLNDKQRIDRRKAPEGAVAAATRVFAVLRLQPELRLDTGSGEQHKARVNLPHIDDTPVPTGAMGCESGEDVLFPSMERLCVAHEMHKSLWADANADHWDAFAASRSASPEDKTLALLLDIRGKLQVRLSKDITVAKFAKREEQFARIDPRLVELLQELVDVLREGHGREDVDLDIWSGYRSWSVHKQTRVTLSPHTRGIAADIRVKVGKDYLAPFALAKAIIDVFAKGSMGLGYYMWNARTNARYVHVDIRHKEHFWEYDPCSEEAKKRYPDGCKRNLEMILKEVEELKEYCRERRKRG